MTSSAGMSSASSYTTAYGSEPATAARRRSSTSPEALRPEMPKRRSSSSRRSNVSYVDDGEDELPHTPLAPPTYASAEDELDEHLAARVSGESALGGWHYAPLLVGIGPPLGAILGGKVDHWSDAILLLLSSFWLYQCLKVPNDIYHAARTRRILQADQIAEEEGHSRESPERLRRQQAALVELQRTEVIALAACVAAPIVGAFLLSWLQENLSDGSRYLNQFNIRLFTLAAGIRPWTHLFSLVRRRTLLLHEDVHYPSAKVESMQRKILRLEADLSSLRKSVVSKTDVRLLRDGIDVPLSQMSRSMRRYEKKEETLRSSAEDRFALVEARLEDLLRETAINAELIEAERLERERTNSVGRNILEALKFVIGQRQTRSNGRRTLPDGSSTSVPAIGQRSYSSEMRSMLGMGSSTGSPPRIGGGPSSPTGAWGPSSNAGSTSTSTTLASASPIRSGSKSDSPTQADVTSPPEWFERGLLFWAFLPLNLSNSMLRFAGDKINGASSTASRRMIGPPLPGGHHHHYQQQYPTSPPATSRGGMSSSVESSGHPSQQQQQRPSISITPSGLGESMGGGKSHEYNSSSPRNEVPSGVHTSPPSHHHQRVPFSSLHSNGAGNNGGATSAFANKPASSQEAWRRSLAGHRSVKV